MDIYGITDIGCARQRNEDSIHWQTGNIPGRIKVQGENRCRGF